MILSLNIMQPTTDTKKRLIRGDKMFGLGDVHESDRLEQLVPVRLVFELVCLDLADLPPRVCHVSVVRTRGALGEDGELPGEVGCQLGNPGFAGGGFLWMWVGKNLIG